MTFAAKELSQTSGAPVELYEFSLGTAYWRYCSGDEDQSYGGFVFAQTNGLGREEIAQGDEANRPQLRIRMPAWLSVPRLFIPYPPQASTLLRIRRLHRADGEVRVIWTGRIISCTIRGPAAELICESWYTSLLRPGLRKHYMVRCAYDLYGSECGVTRASYQVEEALTAVVGAVLTAPSAGAHADGWYSGGFLNWESPEGPRWGSIVAHSGTQLTLERAIPGLYAGATVIYYAGCNHTLLACWTKFFNGENFGGFPWLPDHNPFRVKIY